MQEILKFLTDPVVAGILIVLGALNTLADSLQLVRFGPISLYKWALRKLQHGFFNVPKATLKVIPMNQPFPWNTATIDGKPAMQVGKDLYFTNITTEPALVVGTYLLAYYFKWKIIPWRKKIEGQVSVQHHASNGYGTYTIQPRATTEGRALWFIEPPIRKPGQMLYGRACFVDRFGNEHWTGRLKWEFLR